MIRSCLEPGCPAPAVYRGRCTTHSRKREQSVPRAGRAVYNTKRWAMTRRAKLVQSPLCEYLDPDEGRCGRIATDVHHRHDLAEGGNPFAMENLESLCHSHHSQITRAAQLSDEQRLMVDSHR